MDLATQYLGNLSTDAALAQRVHQAQHHSGCLEVYLDAGDRVKGRIHAHAQSGETVGIVKDRSWAVSAGDVWQTDSGKLLLVHLKDRGLLVLSFDGQTVGDGADDGAALALIQLGHALGNHHYTLSRHHQKLYLPITGDRTLLETTLASFQIPGLVVTYAERSPDSLPLADRFPIHDASRPSAHDA